MQKNTTQSFLAVTAMVGFLAVMVLLLSAPIPEGNKDLFNICLIALVGFVGTAFGYFLGSSQGSAHKTDILSSSNKGEVM